MKSKITPEEAIVLCAKFNAAYASAVTIEDILKMLLEVIEITRGWEMRLDLTDQHKAMKQLVMMGLSTLGMQAFGMSPQFVVEGYLRAGAYNKFVETGKQLAQAVQ